MNEAAILAMVSKSEEFEQIKVRACLGMTKVLAHCSLKTFYI